MVRAAIAFFVLAILAYIFGANGIAGVSMEIGKSLIAIFVILAILAFVMSMFTNRKIR
jgi:uncharacterized membrane protein YtjA (UPF0391 family)